MKMLQFSLALLLSAAPAGFTQSTCDSASDATSPARHNYTYCFTSTYLCGNGSQGQVMQCQVASCTNLGSNPFSGCFWAGGGIMPRCTPSYIPCGSINPCCR